MHFLAATIMLRKRTILLLAVSLRNKTIETVYTMTFPPGGHQSKSANEVGHLACVQNIRVTSKLHERIYIHHSSLDRSLGLVEITQIIRCLRRMRICYLALPVNGEQASSLPSGTRLSRPDIDTFIFANIHSG